MCNNCIANPFILHRTAADKLTSVSLYCGQQHDALSSTLITGMKSESERVGDGGEDEVLCDPLSRDVNGVASASHTCDSMLIC